VTAEGFSKRTSTRRQQQAQSLLDIRDKLCAAVASGLKPRALAGVIDALEHIDAALDVVRPALPARSPDAKVIDLRESVIAVPDRMSL